MTTELTTASTLAEWVTSAPAVAAVLERYELDYCCGGQRPLAAACAERGMAVDAVVAELRDAQAQPVDAGTASIDWSQRSLTELTEHIEQTHHRFLREQLPRLGQLLDKVIAAHGQRHPELASLATSFRALEAELLPHMMKEERVLFPAIRRLEADPVPPRFPFGSVRNPIGVMEHEHDTAGQLLHEMRHLTNGYAPPADACETWRQLLRGLESLEADLFQHIHKENNLLFPAAARLEEG